MKKKDYDRALTRLRIILGRLNDGESLSVKKLADDFAVSTRTIQRDFNERLVPLYPIFQQDKMWKMQDGYKIEKTREIEDIIIKWLPRITIISPRFLNNVIKRTLRKRFESL